MVLNIREDSVLNQGTSKKVRRHAIGELIKCQSLVTGRKTSDLPKEMNPQRHREYLLKDVEVVPSNQN